MKQPTLFQSLIPIFSIVILISINIIIFGNDSMSGANQVALIFAAAISCAISIYNGVKFNKIMESVISTISSAMPAILILLCIGMLSGTWMHSGIMPAIKYYGLFILDDSYFLPATVIICSIISMALGSSWTTIATMGVALLGIGRALGFDDGIIAGAIISGAYFGDKCSPISETSNLSAAIAKSDLFALIRYMTITSIPAIIITLIIFTIIGLFYPLAQENADISALQNGLKEVYNITPWLFIVPAITIFAIIKKVEPIPLLFGASILGAIAMIIFQPELISSISQYENFSIKSAYEVSLKTMFGNTILNSDNTLINNLTATKGMSGMLTTIWLIISAMIFGGALEASGFLAKITNAIMSKVKTVGGVITSTVGTAILFNLTAADQYLSIVITGKMYSDSYQELNLKEVVLARTLQDSATITSVLIPWNTCGAAQASILGIATLTYAPFAFFCILSPIITIIVAWLNIKIYRTK